MLSFCLTFFSNKKKIHERKIQHMKTQKRMGEKIKNILIILFLYIFDFMFYYLLLYFIK